MKSSPTSINVSEKDVTLLNARILTEKVEKLVHRDSIRYSEAIVNVLDEYGIEPSDAGKLVVGPLRAKVEQEAMTFRVIPRRNSNTHSLI